MAACASLVFFACVVLHELAHSIVAKSYGVPVKSITLFLFGGVSNIEHEPTSAKSEFFTAIAGPLTSIALGVLFVFVDGGAHAGLGCGRGRSARGPRSRASVRSRR